MAEIKYDYTHTDRQFHTALGRNGQMKVIGLSATEWAEDSIILDPINSKGNIGRCWITVPKSSIPALIKMLEGFM